MILYVSSSCSFAFRSASAPEQKDRISPESKVTQMADFLFFAWRLIPRFRSRHGTGSIKAMSRANTSLIRSKCGVRDVRVLSRAMTKWITAILLIATVAVVGSPTNADVALVGVLVAQQTHKQYEPANAAGAGQKLLAQFVGEWDVVKTFFPMNGKPIVTKATCKQYMVKDGKFL